MAFRPLLFPVLAMIAGPVAAQTAPSVEGYLCRFAGKCGGVETPVVTKAAPATKGFRLARPVADKSAIDNRASAPRAAIVGRQRPLRAPTAAYDANRHMVVAPAPMTGVGMETGRPRANLMIGFELNSAQLSAEGVRSAQVFAKSLLMPELRSKRFLIEGHTDMRGGRSLNMTLSRDRAKAVADYLVVLGVDRDRLATRGLGPDVPLPGRTKSDPGNRRVEAELIS